MELPWKCPKHPDAKILKSWDESRYIFNGYPRGSGHTTNIKYECAECGIELSKGE